MRILVTGFVPFGHDTENASQAAVRGLAAGPGRPGRELVTADLPVVFATAPAALAGLIERHRPDAVLAVGEAGGRGDVTPEAVGRNVIDARIPDNAGDRPGRRPVVPGGPDERSCPLPVEPVVDALRAAGLPAARSDDAGRFVCNQLAYHLYGSHPRGLFVHVPAVRTTGLAGVGAETDPGVAAHPTVRPAALGVDDLVRALEVCLDMLADDGPGDRWNP